MTFLNLTLFILISAGLTDISVSGKVFDRIRPRYKLFHCYQCLGTWIGAGVFLAFWFSDIKLFPNLYLGVPLFGFLSSFTSNFLCSIFDDEGLKFSKTLKE